MAKCMCSNETSDAIKGCTGCLINMNALDTSVEQAVFTSAFPFHFFVSLILEYQCTNERGIGIETSCKSLGVTLKSNVNGALGNGYAKGGMMGVLLIGAAVVSLL